MKSVFSSKNLIWLFLLLSFLNAQTSINSNSTWTYFFGGQDWGTRFPICRGASQSPINIDTRLVIPLTGNIPLMRLQLRTNDAYISYNFNKNISTTGQFAIMHVILNNGSIIQYNGTQFGVHSPSEHTIDGVHGDIELQFIFHLPPELSHTFNYTILSLIYKNSTNEKSHFFEAWNVTTSTAHTHFNMAEAFEADFLKTRGYYTYFGSLTVPPCEESVQWFVVDEMLPIEDEHIHNIQKHFKHNETFAEGHGNNRKIQPLDDRTIVSQRAVSSDFLIKGAIMIDHFSFIPSIWLIAVLLIFSI